MTLENAAATRGLGRRFMRVGFAIQAVTADAFEDLGVTRRQWRILEYLESNPTSESNLAEQFNARRGRPQCGPGKNAADNSRMLRGVAQFAHHHHRPPHEMNRTWGGRRRELADLLLGLAQRGWIATDGTVWQLTESGKVETARVREGIQASRSRIRGNISEADWATAIKVLDALAENLCE